MIITVPHNFGLNFFWVQVELVGWFDLSGYMVYWGLLLYLCVLFFFFSKYFMEFLVLVIFVILEHLKKRQIMFRIYKIFKKKRKKGSCGQCFTFAILLICIACGFVGIWSVICFLRNSVYMYFVVCCVDNYRHCNKAQTQLHIHVRQYFLKIK